LPTHPPGPAAPGGSPPPGKAPAAGPAPAPPPFRPPPAPHPAEPRVGGRQFPPPRRDCSDPAPPCVSPWSTADSRRYRPHEIRSCRGARADAGRRTCAASPVARAPGRRAAPHRTPGRDVDRSGRQLRPHPHERPYVPDPHHAERPRTAPRPRPVRPGSPFRAREPRPHRRDLTLVLRRLPHPARGRDADQAEPVLPPQPRGAVRHRRG